MIVCDPTVSAADCNENEIEDESEISIEGIADCNGNGIPDDCDLKASLQFESQRSLATGLEPYCVTTADFNGDGRVDFATANQTDNSLSVIISKGEADYSRHVDLRIVANPPNESSSSEPRSVVAADLDGDGDVDLASANGGRVSSSTLDGSVSLLLNSGRGAFVYKPYLLVGAKPQFITALDIERDGDLDLITANQLAGTVSILRNRGPASFGASVDYNAEYGSLFIAVDDLGGDGIADLLVANADAGSVSVLIGKSDGTFEETRSFGAGEYPTSVAVAELNGTGLKDLVVTNVFSDELSIFTGLGDVSFRRSVLSAPEGRPICARAADLDGDGVSEIAVSHASFGNSSVWVLTNQGNGVLKPSLNAKTEIDPIFLNLSDLNSDGRPDLVTANVNSSSVSILLNGSSAFSGDLNKNGIPDECEQRPAFHRGDANGDGQLDISDGLCTLVYLFSDGAVPPCLEAADANNDGAVDCSDSVFTLGYLYLGTRLPPEPGPAPRPCGVDPDPLGSAADLGCQQYAGCAPGDETFAQESR